MNVAALLQDSPSEDRRRPPQPQPSPSLPPPNPPHHPSHSLSDPRQQPPSPQWSRSSARAHPPAQYSQWPPPSYIRPSSTHPDPAAPSRDPPPASAWSPPPPPPQQQHSRSHSQSRPLTPQSSYTQDSRAQIGPVGPGSGGGIGSGERMGAPPPMMGNGIMQRGRADSHASQHGRPSSSSPSTPFHPSPRSQQALSQSQSQNSQNRTQRPGISPSTSSSIPAERASMHPHPQQHPHASPAMPPLRPTVSAIIESGPNTINRDGIIRDPNASSSGTNTIPVPSPRVITSSGSPAVSPPTHHQKSSGDRYAPVPSSSLSQASNLIDRHAHAGTTSSNVVTHAQAHPPPPHPPLGSGSGLGSSRSERDLLRERDIMQSQRGAMDMANRERDRADRERERERDRRRLSNAASSNPPHPVSNLVGPGTGGPPPFLLSEDKTHSHSSSGPGSLSNMDPRGPPSNSNAPLPPPMNGPRRADSTSSTTTPTGGMSISRRPSGGRDSENDVAMRDIRDRDREREARDRDIRDMRERDMRELRDREMREREMRERDRELRDKKDRELAMRDRERAAAAAGRLGPPPLPSPTTAHPPPPGQSPYLTMDVRERDRDTREREYREREREKERAREREREREREKERERGDMEQIRVLRQQQQQMQFQRDKERERDREAREQRERLPGPGIIGPGVIPSNAPPPPTLPLSTTAAAMAADRLSRPGSPPEPISLKHMYDRDPRDTRERERDLEREREREKERERKERDWERVAATHSSSSSLHRPPSSSGGGPGRRLERDPRDIRDARDPRDVRDGRDAFAHPLVPQQQQHMSGIHPQSRPASIPPRGPSPPPGPTASPLQTMPPSSSSSAGAPPPPSSAGGGVGVGVLGPGIPPPQREFQHQFHTQFVPGLSTQIQHQRMEGTSSAVGSRMGSPVPLPGPGQASGSNTGAGPSAGPSAGAVMGPSIVGPGMGLDKRDRERERDPKKAVVGGSGRSSALVKERDSGPEGRDRDRDRDRERMRERERLRERDSQLLRDTKGRDVYSVMHSERERERRGPPPDDSHFPPDSYLQQRTQPPPPSSSSSHSGYLSQQQKRQEQEQREQRDRERGEREQQQQQQQRVLNQPPSTPHELAMMEQQRLTRYQYNLPMMMDDAAAMQVDRHPSMPHPLHPSVHHQQGQLSSSSHAYHPDSRHPHPDLMHHRERERERERDRDRDRDNRAMVDRDRDRDGNWFDAFHAPFDNARAGWHEEIYAAQELSAFVGRRGEREREREMAVVKEQRERERDRDRDRERERGRERQMEWDREWDREYQQSQLQQQQQQLQHAHAHPGHLHPHQLERERELQLQHHQHQQQLQEQQLQHQQRERERELQQQHHHHIMQHHQPPQGIHLQDSVISMSGAAIAIEVEEDLPLSSMYGSYADVDAAEDWDEWREAELERKRARVQVDLGTYVYPSLPFPYFFELGGGLVAAKDREEERERLRDLEEKKVREENEKKDREEKERLEQDQKEKERKEKEETEKLEREKREKEEKERLEKEVKERLKKLQEAAEKMEEGEIDEDSDKEKEITALRKRVKEKEEAERAKEAGQQLHLDKVIEETQPAQVRDKEKDKDPLVKEKEKSTQPDTSIATLNNTTSNDASASTLLPSSDDLPVEHEPPSPRPLLDVETRTTILIPSGYIPIEKPSRPRLWGGGGFDPRPRPPLSVRARTRKKGPSSANGKRTRPSAISRHNSGHSQLANSTTANVIGLASSSSSGGPNGASTPAKSRSAPSHRSRRPRRVYTDDSDIFLCAIHSGWLTWSGARQARANGRDMRVEIRVLRCAGSGPDSVFAYGAGKTAGIDGVNPNQGNAPPTIVREEMIGRFVGGYGERCFNPLGKTGKIAGEDAEEEGNEDELERREEEDMMFDDPEDDGRSLVSAAWGTGHDGSAIEIVGVEFVERATAHTAPGTGRRNRSQRLLEYAERRAVVFGQPAARFAGRKRRRGSGWDGWPVQPRHQPNASVLDVIYEVDEEDLEEEAEDPTDAGLKALKVRDEERLMNTRTLVFGMGAAGDFRVGYKYDPSLLKRILFPSPHSSAGSDAPPPRKRRRMQEPDVSEDVEMVDIIAPPAAPEISKDEDTPRPVILETAKESYLLSPSVLLSPTGSTSKRVYDIALILEAEVVVEEEQAAVEVVGSGEGNPPRKVAALETADVSMADSEAVMKEYDVPIASSTEATLPKHDEQPVDPSSKSTEQAIMAADNARTPKQEPSKLLMSAPGSSPLPPPRASPIHSPEPIHKDIDGELPPSSPPPTDKASLLLDDEITKPQFAVQVLQRNLSKDMFRFTDDSVYVLDLSGEGGMDAEWAIQVKDWKWAPKGAKERLL